MNTKINLNYKQIVMIKREANARALKATLAILGAVTVTFFGLRMCNQPVKAAPTAQPIAEQQDFDYFKAHSSSNAAVKLKYDEMAGGK
jgi:hypothetical protein